MFLCQCDRTRASELRSRGSGRACWSKVGGTAFDDFDCSGASSNLAKSFEIARGVLRNKHLLWNPKPERKKVNENISLFINKMMSKPPIIYIAYVAAPLGLYVFFASLKSGILETKNLFARHYSDEQGTNAFVRTDVYETLPVLATLRRFLTSTVLESASHCFLRIVLARVEGGLNAFRFQLFFGGYKPSTNSLMQAW